MSLAKRFASGGSLRPSGRSFLEVDWFFDKPAVTWAVDGAARRVLSKFGAFVRSTARRSIRKPRRVPVGELSESQLRRYRETGTRPFAPSRPGEPPRNQTGLLRDNIFFFYDRSERSVTIAPAKMRSDDVPGVLEHGGMTRVRPSGRMAKIEPRPYMGPALEKEESKLEPLWRNSVR